MSSATEKELLQTLGRLLNTEELSTIAKADYEESVEKHLGALEKIRDEGTVPKKLGWYPREVCELIRWSKPDDPKWKPGLTGLSGHRIRAFSCAVLLCASAPNEMDLTEVQNTLAQFTESVLELEPEHIALAQQWLAWRITGAAQSDPAVETLLRLALLVLRVASQSWDELEPAVRSIEDGFERAGDDYRPSRQSLRVLFGEMCLGQWDSLLRRQLLLPQTHFPPAVAAPLGRILRMARIGRR